MKRKKFDFVIWLINKDGPIVKLANFVHGAKRLWGLGDWRAKWQAKKMLPQFEIKDRELFVFLNGPSVKKQPLERVARRKDIDCIFVNQGFKLPQYKMLHPKFHVFIDTKMLKGIWDVHWIDEILEMVPDITFVMPPSWAKHPVIKPYVDRGVRILWWQTPIKNLAHGVSATAFQLGWRLGYKRIYFTGYEQTATPAYMLKQASHFYGNDPDVETHDTTYIIKDLYMNACHLLVAQASARYAKQIGVDMVNLTDGGLMDMFRRERFEDVFPE